RLRARPRARAAPRSDAEAGRGPERVRAAHPAARPIHGPRPEPDRTLGALRRAPGAARAVDGGSRFARRVAALFRLGPARPAGPVEAGLVPSRLARARPDAAAAGREGTRLRRGRQAGPGNVRAPAPASRAAGVPESAGARPDRAVHV